MFDNAKKIVVAVALAAVVGLYAQNALSDREAIVAYISQFNEPGRCDCYKDEDTPCSSIYNAWADNFANYLANMIEVWYVDDPGSRVNRPSNMGVNHSEWADVTSDGYGADHVSPYGADTFDVAFIYTHGGRDDEEGGSRIVMGSPSAGNDCTLTYGGDDSHNHQDVEWGDSDLNYAIVYACRSLGFFDFMLGYYDDESVREPNFNMLMGFHGNSIAGDAYYNRFKDFVNGTHYNGLGEDWVDEVTHIQSGADICATAAVYADNASDAGHIFQYGGFEDYQSSYYGEGHREIWGVAGCSPGNDIPIPYGNWSFSGY